MAYLTTKEIADRAVEVDGGDNTIVVFEDRLVVVDCFKNEILSKRFDSGMSYLVEIVPFQYFDEYPTDEDDEDYEMEYDEYLEDESIPECVFIDGHIFVLNGKIDN